MAEKFVDVFLRDKLVASYPVVLDKLSVAISEQDFIGLARDAMREDGSTARPSGCEQMNSRRDPDDYEAWVSQYIPSRLLISGRSILIGVVIAAGLIIGACQFSALITMSDRVAMAARVKI